MKTLYLDCQMGAAGDMLTAALVQLLPDPDGFVKRLNTLFDDVHFDLQPSEKCGITGRHMSVKVHGMEEHEHHHEHEHEHEHHHEHEHDHEHHHEHEHEHEHEHHHGHHHTSVADIEGMVAKLDIPEKVKTDINAVYGLIARAESTVHGKPVDQIHFHEVGTLDALADVTAVCLAINELSPAAIYASPVHVGCGSVHCAHGILPVPAPATEHILRGVPVYGGKIKGELCTPTGAALLKHFADRFGDMPVMSITSAGYGMGTKDFEQANCVRALLGETEDREQRAVLLSCNVDDMTAEDISYAVKMLFAAGAADVYTLPVFMKKGRQGTLICVLCFEENKNSILQIIFAHTSTIGIREEIITRHVLDRRIETVDTPFGTVRRKVSTGYGVTKIKYEHDDLEKIAAGKDLAIEEIRRQLYRDEK